jgi:hypothetical protein
VGNSNTKLLCRCGYEHTSNSFIEFRRDAISNQVKLFCRKCGKRLFPEYITTSSREFREIFLGDDPNDLPKTQL